jgi:uncharacterized protein (UPF0216 family)
MVMIDEEIDKLKKFIQISKNTIEELVEEGQPQEVIDSEKESLRLDEEELERLLKLKGEK